MLRREHPGLGPRVRQSFVDPTSIPLTEREWDVIRSFKPGRSNQVIANQLGITERTVKFHFKNIFEKLQVPSREHLAALGLIPPHDKALSSDPDEPTIP